MIEDEDDDEEDGEFALVDDGIEPPEELPEPDESSGLDDDERRDLRWGPYLEELKAKVELTPEEDETLKWLQNYFGETPSVGS